MTMHGDPPYDPSRAPQPEAQPGIIRWEAPPARGTAKYVATADTLKAHPGEWAIVQVAVGEGKVNAAGWRKGLTSLLGKGKVEVREHSIPDSETRVYARYTG